MGDLVRLLNVRQWKKIDPQPEIHATQSEEKTE